MKKLVALFALYVCVGAAFGQLARSFNASGDSLQSASGLSTGSTDTLSVVFDMYKPSYTNADSWMIASRRFYVPNDGTFLINPDCSSPSGQFCVSVTEAFGNLTCYFARPSAAAWHHYAIDIFSGGASGTCTVYVDGSSVAVSYASQSGATTNFSADQIDVGQRIDFGPAFNFVGYLSRIAIFTGSLSGADASAIAGCASPTTATSATLVNYWPINQTSPELPTAGSINLNVSGTTNVAGSCAAGPSLSASPSLVPIASTGNTITLTGTSTSWTPGTPGSPTFTVTNSGGTSCAITAQTVSSTTSAAVTFNAGSTAGTCRINDPANSTHTDITIIAPQTWYVNPTTGGTRYSATNTSGQCNGLSATAYVSGTNQSCPYNDPRDLWNDPSVGGDQNWVIAGGDTVIISGYEQSTGLIGAIAGSSGGHCAGVGQCTPPSVPSGTLLSPTRILGANYASCGTNVYGGDPTKVEYLASVNTDGVYALALNSSQYVHVECLNVNGEGNNASYGIFLGNSGNARTAANITLNNVTIQGMKSRGIFGPIAGPFTVTDTELYMNALAGWDFDDGSADPSSGLVTASYLGIDWSGCKQEWPLSHTIPVANNGCQDDGGIGYGDGIGTPVTANLDFSCDHCRFTYNTQDGSDFVHLINANVSITNSYYAGNMGSNMKLGPEASATLANNEVNMNCIRMAFPITGAQTGFNSLLSDFCRAAGDMNSVNVLTNAQYVGNAYAVGTAVTGTDTSFTTQLSVGKEIAPADFPYSTYGGRTVASITDDTHLTVSSAYPTNWGGPGGSALHLLYVPATPVSTTVVNWFFNSVVGYGATTIQGGCSFGFRAGGGYASAAADPSYCPGYAFNFKDNLILGFVDQNCSSPNCGNGTAPPEVFDGISPTTQDYNLFYNTKLNSSWCVGAHDLCSNNPLFTSQPALTIPSGQESSLDNFNYYPTGPSPAVHAGVSAGGITTDFSGASRPNPPSIGSLEPAGTPTAATPTFSPLSGAYPFPFNMTISDAIGGLTICQNTTGSPQTNSGSGCTVGALYTVPIAINSAQTRYAVAGDADYLDSPVGSVTYTQAQAATPVSSPANGYSGVATTLTYTCSTPSSSIFYTTGGGTPGTLYTGGISVTTTSTYRAFCRASGYLDSAVVSTALTITAPSGGGVQTGGSFSLSGSVVIQ